MIQETPLYLLKVNIALIIFYGLYLLILRQKTFFQANRFFLLYAVYISFYLPLIEFPVHFNAPINEQPNLINQITLPITETSWAFQYESLQPLQYQSAMFNLTFGHLFLIAYVLGAGYFGVQLIIRLLNLKRIIQQSNPSKYGEQNALIHPEMPVSSFFSYLFWKKENEHLDYLLVEHEKVHMRQWHSLDILVMEVTGVIMWFNPLVKYIANDLRLLHEFIADAEVVNKFGQKSTYTQLLCRQTLAPAPLFTNNFHSFIKNRLRMLQQKKSSVFSYSHYLLLIPTLLGLVVLLMSPSGKDTLSRVQDQLNKIQDQSMLSFNINESQVKEPVYMQWGDLKFGISKNDMSHTFSTYIDIPKKDILENINAPFEIIDTRSDQTFNMETAGLNFYYSCQNSQDPNGIRIETSDVGQWKNFISTLKSNLTALSDACQFNLMASFDETVVVVTIFITDEPTRKIYLENENHRYITESYNAQSAIGIPLVYHNNNNQINLRELEQILTSTHHTIVDHGESFRSNDFKIYYLRDLSTSLDRLSLLSKVKIAKEIDDPIAIVIKAINGNQYISIFDDDARAEVTFDTWDEYFNVAQFLHLRFKHIKEQCDFKWGPLDLKSPNSDLHLTFLSNRPTSDFLGKFQQEVSLTQIQNILKSSPELMINDKPVPQCTINFTYVDHKYLPFRCQLVFNDGVLVQGKEYLAAIQERIKPNDFIEYLEIKSDGLTKMSGIRFQIK